jgi:serine beta-lactamase-like protein LACTB, mitochondrial
MKTFVVRLTALPVVPWLAAAIVTVCGTGGATGSTFQVSGRYAEAPTASAYIEAIHDARSVIDSLMDAESIPGLSVAVGVGGTIVWSEGFGFADVENRVLVTPLTTFRIGSVSKTLTADAIAMLVQDGQLDLDARVQQYVPSFPTKRWPITTRLVGGHLAGIRHYRGNESVGEGQRSYADVVSSLSIFEDDSLLFQPGTQYSYSSYGWNLISAVVQGASGTRFLDFMDRRVFERLGMRHTVADHVDSIIAFRTRYYQRDFHGHVRNAQFVNNSYKWAGGGFLSTMEDLVQFGFAHLDTTYLRATTIALLWSSQHTADGSATNYGIGWRTYEDDRGRRVVGHGGSSVGGRTQFLMYPNEQVVVAVTANLSEASISEQFALRIAAGFLDAP